MSAVYYLTNALSHAWGISTHFDLWTHAELLCLRLSQSREVWRKKAIVF